MNSPALEFELANEGEVAGIAELRSALEPEISKLAAEGCDFPHTTGDIFMTRVLRGNGGNIEESCTWFRKYLAAREKYDLDRVHRACEADATPWRASAMPHAELVTKWCTMLFDEESAKTPGGHLLWYDHMGDGRVDMLQEVSKEQYVEFQRFACERRMSLLDRLSREEGRMVKIVRILDFEGVTIGMVRSELNKLNRREIQPMMISTAIEVIQRLYLLNFPTWAFQIYRAVSVVLPPRFLNRIRIHGKDFLRDPELAADVGSTQLMRCLKMRKVDATSDDGALQGTAKVIGAGAIMERAFDVSSGQRVAWKFEVGSAADCSKAARGMLGMAMDIASGEDNTLVFSASLLTDMNPDVEVHKQTIQEPTVVDAASGEVSGTFLASTSGVVLLQWSNANTWVRAKVLTSFTVTAEENEAEVDADDIFAGIDAAM